MKVNPYLNFDGNTKEAFDFYKKVFGGEFSTVMLYKDVPVSEQKMPENEANLVMHISLPIGNDCILMGSDISKELGHKLTIGNNNYISLAPDSLEESKRIFEELSEGGNVEMPLAKMFWGDHFASFSDKFGVYWMINYSDTQEK